MFIRIIGRRSLQKQNNTVPAHRRAVSWPIRSVVETCEPRVMFAMLTVNTASDNTTSDNFLSLREAVDLIQSSGNANTALGRSITAGEQSQINTTVPYGTNDTIVFANSLAGGNVAVGSAFSITGLLTIDGGNSGVTLSGGSSIAAWQAFNLPNSTSDLTLDHLTATHFGDSVGGAIINSGTLAINNCTFIQNSATFGGALYNNGALTINNSTFSQNSTGNYYGGALFQTDGTANITNSTFTQNAAGYGGAFLLGHGSANFTNCTFTQNSATHGAVIAVGAGALTVDFSTLSLNTSTDANGILASFDGTNPASVTITNSILGQTNNSVADLVVGSGVTIAGSNNLIRNTAVAGIGNVSTADPLLDALADNGGPTQTMALQVGSPALNVAASTSLTTDQRGDARVYNGQADIGAYESQLPVAPSITSVSHVTFVAGLAGTFTITTTGHPAASLNVLGTLPVGVTFVDHSDGTATLAGTPAAGSNTPYALIIVASNGGSPDATQMFTLTVNQALTVTSANHAAFIAGAASTFIINTVGDPVAAITEVGSLPIGVTLVDNGNGTATLSGTTAATNTGTYAFTINGADGVMPNAQQSFTLTVVAPPTFTTANSTVFSTVNSDSFSINTTAYPTAALTVIGSLPTGVTFVDNGNGSASLAGKPRVGSYTFTITASNGVLPNATQSFTLTTSSPANTTFSIASATASRKNVLVYNDNGTLELSIANPYLRSAITTAMGDVTGDGIQDVIVAAGPGKQPKVTVFDGNTGQEISEFLAFSRGYRGGLSVATGDVNGDGISDIIVGTRAKRQKAQVKVFNGTNDSLMASFTTFNTGGVRVAAGDINGDGYADVVAMQGPSGNASKLEVFDGSNLSSGVVHMISKTTPFGRNYHQGSYVTTADVNGGGHAEIILSQNKGGKSSLLVINPTTNAVISTFKSTKINVPLTSLDANRDGIDDLVVTTKLKNKYVVDIFSGANDSLLKSFPIAG